MTRNESGTSLRSVEVGATQGAWWQQWQMDKQVVHTDLFQTSGSGITHPPSPSRLTEQSPRPSVFSVLVVRGGCTIRSSTRQSVASSLWCWGSIITIEHKQDCLCTYHVSYNTGNVWQVKIANRIIASKIPIIFQTFHMCTVQLLGRYIQVSWYIMKLYFTLWKLHQPNFRFDLLLLGPGRMF